MKLSVVMLTWNCNETLKRSIDSVIDLADEIILVDEQSTDGTLDTAKEYSKVRVCDYRMKDFADARNHGADQAQGEWVLMHDSDEYITGKLQQEIKDVLSDPRYAAYDFRRIHIFLGKPIKHCDYNSYTSMPRLYKKGLARFIKPVHEELDYKGEIGLLKSYSLHDNARDLKQFVLKIVKYSHMEAEKMAQSAQRKNVGIGLILHRTLKEFFKRYFRKKGFLDGMRGFVLSSLESLSCFLILVFYLEEVRKRGEK